MIETTITRDIVPIHLNELQDAVEALGALIRPFIGTQEPARGATSVAAAAVPPPFDGLLVHTDHMTTRLESFHGCPVTLDVVRQSEEDGLYSRLITLRTAGPGRIVEVGIVRIDLSYTSPDVRREILEQARPLGEILIGYDVMRKIEPKWYLRFHREAPLLDLFGRPLGSAVYGRLGVIYCDGAPAIELLEIVSQR